MAAALGGRIRYGAVVEAVSIASAVCSVRLRGGETLAAEAVVCALPVGPLRDVAVEGVAPERLASLHAQRHALAAKAVSIFDRSVWADVGANGLSEGEGVLASTWAQHEGVLSALVPPERLGLLLAVPERDRAELVRDELERMYGAAARETRTVHLRLWGTDPFTQGYVTQWWPFYICGSDQWVAGYMEGAVRTGRAAAAAALSGS